jgi:hypothetical protein
MLAMHIGGDEMHLNKRISFSMPFIFYFLFFVYFILFFYFALTLVVGHKSSAILDYEELVDQCIAPTYNLYVLLVIFILFLL